MLINYLKIALRNIKRHKGYSFINIAGLAIGISCCILIMLWVRHELSYDRFHENAENIYRVIMDQPWNVWQGKSLWNITPGAFAPCAKQDFPEIVHVARIRSSSALISYNNKHFNEDNIFFADPEFLEIFSFPLVSGDSRTALNEPYSVLMTEEMKEKYFGDEDPLGKIINLDKKYDYTVKGVLKNIPDNSHLKFDFLLSFSTFYAQKGKDRVEDWRYNRYSTYLLLPDSYDPENLNQKFPEFVKKYKDKEREEETFYLQPIEKIHLHSRNIHDRPRGDIRYIYFYSVIAFFIMLIACFNYMNLSTARSSTRAKEVGLRKVVGADRQSLIRQFLGESMVFSLIALLIAVILAGFFLPAFNSLIDKNLRLNIFQDLSLLFLLMGLMALVGIISGSYPALFLSSFQPTTILRGTTTKGTGGSSFLRNSFIVFQFSISIALIICTLVVSSQLRFIRNNLGFNREEIVVVYVQDENLRRNYGPMKSVLSQNPHILDITVSNNLPNNFTGNNIFRNPSWAGKSAPESFYVNYSYVDYNFFDFYGIKLLKGRNFSQEHPSDADQAYIINETAAKVIGWDNPIGKRLEEGIVIGIVKDFHFQSLHREIEPLAIRLNRPERNRYFTLKIRPENLEATLQFIEKKWKEFSPGYPFIYSFFDEMLDRTYMSEQRLYKTFNYFAFLAVFISCLGLFGLATFIAEKKTKEIGIRKVLGASVSTIIILLSKRLIRWVLISNIIAWPIAYYAMHRWLQNFAYRINIGLLTFILAAALALIIALLTVSYQAIKAALANPVDSLRYE